MLGKLFPRIIKYKPWWMGAFLVALVLACYWSALNGSPVWDDQAHITKPELQSLVGLARIWTDIHSTQQYYPVLHSAFWLEHRLWGDTALGYHLANVLLHAVACLLLALLLGRLWHSEKLTARVPPGTEWFAAVLLAVHPVCVESVAWISEQKNTLSLVFYLLSALVFLDFSSRRKFTSYALAFAFFILALGTKSVTATLPAALLVVLWWRDGRLAWKQTVVPLLPWFLAALMAGLFTAWIELTLIGARGSAFDLSTVQRLLLASRVVWFYLGKLCWPADLMFIYPRWDVAASATNWLVYLIGTGVLTALLWMNRKRSRGPLAVWLLFIGSLCPALGFFNVYPFVFSYVADHFQYLACISMLSGAAAGAALLGGEFPPAVRSIMKVVCVMLLALLAILSNRYSSSYRDCETLYRDTLERNPSCWMAHTNLAAELVKSPDRVQEAIIHYEQALSLKPDNAEAHNNLANELVKLPGRMNDAISHFEQALQLQPGFVEAHLNLANALARIEDRKLEAFVHYQSALQLDPRNAEIHYCLANTLASLPQFSSEAQREYELTLKLRPNYAEAHDGLASLIGKDPERMTEARTHYETALRLNPLLYKTHYNLAILLALTPGQETEALLHYQEALKINPNYAEAHNNLAILYAQAGRLDDAKKHWLLAIKINPAYEDARRNLELLEQLGRK